MAYDPKTSNALLNKLRADVDGLLVRNAILNMELPTGEDGGSATMAITADMTTITADQTSYTADQTVVDWTPRSINQISYDEGETVEMLAGNTFTLLPGKYKIKAMFTFHNTQSTRIALWNGTDQTTVAFGMNAFFSGADTGATTVVALVSPKKKTSYQIRYQVERAQSGDGLGIATDFAGVPEQYGALEITRINQLKP
jgi:hypothetical protein